MKLAIVMPVVLQTEALLTLTREAVSHLKSTHTIILYVVCNRLHIRVPDILQEDLKSLEWSEAWQALGTKAVNWLWLTAPTTWLFVANDTRLREDCLDKLIEFGERGEADLWSAISFNNRSHINPNEVTDGADFSCFMVRPGTLQKHGFFDPNYRPAYFEDNDYYGRVILGSGECRVVHRAQFFHHGSMTVREDTEMAHHVSHWFAKNRAYFSKKWGAAQPENSREGVLRHYYRHPFNDPHKPLSWFPTDSNTA